MQKQISTKRKIMTFVLTILFTLCLFFFAVNTGGIKTTVPQLLNGLFVEYDKDVAIIFELRFPRIVVALLGGMLMAVSGVLMQAVMKNPLADPGIIGVTSGAALVAVLVTAFFPALAKMTPVFSFVGGMVAFVIVYTLAWNGQISPIRLILVGIAVDAMFSGVLNAFSAGTGGSLTGVASIINSNISLKIWNDVKILLVYSLIALVGCTLIADKCNLLCSHWIFQWNRMEECKLHIKLRYNFKFSE